jgi:hypothetical protein
MNLNSSVKLDSYIPYTLFKKEHKRHALSGFYIANYSGVKCRQLITVRHTVIAQGIDKERKIIVDYTFRENKKPGSLKRRGTVNKNRTRGI